MTEQHLYNYCLRMGDNALILSYRLSEWCSNAPMLEEDLALTNFALDLIGRAQAILKYASELQGGVKTEDDLAYRRGEREYYNHLITELPNGDFAQTMVRQLFISAFEFYFFTELQKSTNVTLSAIAAKTLKEVKYHLMHATDWVIRLGDGTAESHKRMQDAINYLWMFTGELFEMDLIDTVLIEKGVGVDLMLLQPKWHRHIQQVMYDATLLIPEEGFMQTGSRKGIHTEYLGHILSEMQYLQRTYPDAIW